MTNSSKTVKLGFIGAGFIGQVAHIANYVQIKNCQIVALAAGRPELRQKVAKHYDIARTYTTHRELLEDKEVEAVVAVTGRLETGPVALDCLNAGKPLLTEKPMASTLEQAERLVRAAQYNRVIYAIGYMKRYDEGVQTAKKILDDLAKSGELGPIVYARAHCFGGDAYCQCDGYITTNETKTQGRETWSMAPDWIPEERREEYHQYLNRYCHDINLLRYLLGKSPSVSHVQSSASGFQVVAFDFKDHMAVLETGQFLHQGWDEVIEIYFERGRLRIRMPPPLLRNVSAQVELYQGEEAQQICLPRLEWSWAFRRQAESYIRDICAKRESISSGADSLDDMRIIEEIWKMKVKRSSKLSTKVEYAR